ncbi:MAG: GMC oxidoreductase [Planctomycetota bacterium]
MSWQYFVDHYDDPPTGPDPKRVQDPEHRGFNKIFYPRATGIGGCTIHHAMITMAGPSSDWDDLADFLDDDSWRGNRMREYFKRLEHNDYSKPPTPPPTTWLGRAWDNTKWLFGRTPDHSGGQHGFNGWLHTSVTDVSLGLFDKQLVKMLKAALIQSKQSGLDRAGTLVRDILGGRIRQALDPNHAKTQAESPEGVLLIPLSVCGDRTTVHQNREQPDVQRGRRSSPREFLMEVKAKHPDNLTIWTDCLVTKVILNDTKDRAVGVEILQGERLYRANPNPSEEPGECGKVYVKDGGEVILCGGSFNTPQLLMLSGIGDPEELREQGITLAADLPGVGKNLQDRYEVTVISEMNEEFSLLRDATFRFPIAPDEPDPHLVEWRKHGTGLYTSNGAVLGILKRSRPDLAQPDLFIFGVPLPFRGYELGYSTVGDQHNFFTWTILKAQTNNRGGTVKLRSKDPLDTPEINFHYFNEYDREDKGLNDPDLVAMVDGVKFVRGIANQPIARLVVRREHHPSLTQVTGSSDAQIRNWVRREAWGHHACGTCRMGADGDKDAVLDSRFRVRGVKGLRVVDASIFPKIPGYFIVTNIYMASEKAADVISEDYEALADDDITYPRSLRHEEADAIRSRRDKTPDMPDSYSEFDGEQWPDDVTGLAISGGGIRSATFSLGILQAMAAGKWLRRVDFLSTVSGGGYIGSFLGRAFDRSRADSLAGPKGVTSRTTTEQVEAELTDPDSPWINWLRKHGNYIAPNGNRDWRLGIATYLRNLLSVHFVIGALMLAVFGAANLIRYGLFDPGTAGLGLVMLESGDLPLGYLLRALLGPFFSPWFLLFELLLLFLVVPKIIGYWVVSQDRHERFHWVSLSLLFLVGGGLLFLGVNEGLAPQPLAVGLAIFACFVPVEMAWRRGDVREQAVGSGGTEARRLRTRNYLTHDLGLVLLFVGVALLFAFVDTLGHGLQQWVVAENMTYAAAFASIGAAVVAITPVLRMAAGLFASQSPTTAPPSTLRRIFKSKGIAIAMATVFLIIPLVIYSFAAHVVFEGGDALFAGLLATIAAITVTLILRWPLAVPFVNRSSLSQLYSARLARAFLGASNPLRQRPDGANITEVLDGDDVASIRDYQPHHAGGPLHLINVVVNQTIDFSSLGASMDRQGEVMAVSSVGLSVGQKWHSLWRDSHQGHSSVPGRARLEPAGHAAGNAHPLLTESGSPTDHAETLSLRQWIGISGAAIGPGRGQNTALGTALLFGLANLRTGYWWNSGITEWAREGFPRLTFLRRALALLPNFFLTQSLLLGEWIARFAGPWRQFWNLSDGGFAENIGAYELIRRRVPRIIVCDGSGDPTYNFESFGESIRKVRIDFDANVTPFSEKDFVNHVPQELHQFIGQPDQLRDAQSRKHAALYWVEYATGRRSVMLYLKASMSGDETDDIQHYHSAHPEFPHEATGDQVFDEAQWESYRKLGQHIASPLMNHANWFWAISLDRPS